MKVFADILRFLADLMDPVNLSVNVTGDPVSSVANAVTGAEALGTASIKYLTDLQADLNSPDMKKAEAAKQRLAEMDELTIAQKNDDVQKEREAFEKVGA
jgi:hypothetical protein